MKDEIKFYLSKKRLLEIGKYINRQLIIHRNVEHDGNWTTEEKMIVQLYNSVVALLEYIPNLQQKLEYYENIYPDKTIDKFRQKINKEMSNLQEENKRLRKDYGRLLQDNAYTLELEQKIDKAIDKIQYIIDYGFDYDGFNTVESLKGLIDMLVDYARQSKDILQGENDDRRNME